MFGRLHKRQVLQVGDWVLINPEGREGDFVLFEVVTQPSGMAVEPFSKFSVIRPASAHDAFAGGNKNHSVFRVGECALL